MSEIEFKVPKKSKKLVTSLLSKNNIEIINEINAEYCEDLDILNIDGKILNYFAMRVANAKLKLPLLKEEEEKLEKFNGYFNDFQLLELKIKKLKQEIDITKILDQKDKYVEETQKLLNEYTSLSSICYIDIEKSPINVLKNEKKTEIVDKYVSIVGKYIKSNIIKISKDADEEIRCDECEIKIDRSQEEAFCICGYKLPVTTKMSTFKDTPKSGSSANGYEDLKNFTKAFMAFQGEHIPVSALPSSLFSRLDEFFLTIGWKSGEYYRSLPHLPDGKKAGTYFTDMIRALESIGMPDQYNNVYLIMQEYWGWKLMDLSSYKAQIFEDYNRTQKEWDIIKDRDSSPNVKIRLYLHLFARGIKVSKKDFKFPTTTICLNYYNTKLREVFEKCDLKYEELI